MTSGEKNKPVLHFRLGSDQGGEGVIELGQGLDMQRETGEPVMGGGVQHQPGQRVVTLEDVSANRNELESVDLSSCSSERRKFVYKSRRKLHIA